MNLVNMKVNLDEAKNAIGPHEVMLTLNEVTDQLFKEQVFVHMEIEVIQGTRTVLDNGQVEYKFLLDNDKADALRKALVSAVFPTTDN